MNRNDILIEADELLKKINNKNIRIFDASVVDDMYLMGHIPGAVYFDHDRFSDLASPYSCTILPETKLEEQIGKAGISNDSEVVVYACGMLPYAVRAWWVLHYAGHNNVRILNGGLSAWKNAGGNTEQTTSEYEPSIFKAKFNPSMFASKEEVMASMTNEHTAIINVMPRESYEASHITDSINLSCMDLMNGLEYLLPDDKLASRLQEVTQYKRIITYCGGGIAATVNAIAHLMTGYNNVSVYDGSMYEWLGEGLPVDGNGKWEIWQQH